MPKYLPGVYVENVTPPAELQIITTSLPPATVGVFYETFLLYQGGVEPVTWSLVSPNNVLPSGLNRDGNRIYGTPVSAGSSPITVRATDNLGTQRTNGPMSLVVNAVNTLTVTTTSLPPAKRNVFYNQQLTAVNNTGAVTWDLVDPYDTLPAGLSLVGDRIQGTPTVFETVTIVARATDSVTNAISGGLSLIVNQVDALVITSGSPLPNGEDDTVYNRPPLVSSGGWGAKTWTVIEGTLPAGLTLHATNATFDGTPTTPEIKTFTIECEDSEGRIATKVFQMTIVAAGTIEGPDDYYNEWSVHATNWGKYKLKGRTDEQLQALQQTVSQPLNGTWGYHPESDTHPEAQDAMKLTVDKFKADGVTRVWSIAGANQLYLWLDSRVDAPDTILYTWDWYWCQEFATNSGGVYAYKTWQTRNTKSAGWWTHLHRIYGDTDTVHYFDAMRVGRSEAMAPDGMTHPGDDRVAPLGLGVYVSQINYRNAKQTPPSKWCRYWVEIKLGQPGEDFTDWQAATGTLPGKNPSDMSGLNRWNMLSMWVATEDEEVERIMYRVPMAWGFARAKNVESATINSFVTTGDSDDNWPSSYVGGTITLFIDNEVVVRTIQSVSGRELVVTENFPRVPDVGTLWVYGGDNYIPSMSLLSYEMNTSKVGPIGPMYGYGRDFMAFKNYALAVAPESDPIFRKPVR